MSIYSRLTTYTAAAALALGTLTAAPAVAAPVEIQQLQPAAPTQEVPTNHVTAGVTSEQNKRVPKGGIWSEAYFNSPVNSYGQSVELHADVIRPAKVGNAKTPVILSVGPYFNHGGQASPNNETIAGPSERFNDLIEGGRLMDRGYTVVYVDLRGYGGSSGCRDWVGPGEQADIRTAIRWAATQPWSNGNVGMYGKSYDATTGLSAAGDRVPGLKAVVAQEPLWNMYNYTWSNSVARWNVSGTPQTYNYIARILPTQGDSSRYKNNNGVSERIQDCDRDNVRNVTLNPNATATQWQQRDLVTKARGATVPLFFTQGFTESNTKPEQMQTFLQNHTGVQRGWLGPWEHVRGNERESNGALSMGRAGWFDEVMSFYDQHLKGVSPTTNYPNFSIQDSNGKWRAQSTWPSASRSGSVTLRTGSYQDLDPDWALSSSTSRSSGSRWQASTPDENGHQPGDMEYREPVLPRMRQQSGDAQIMQQAPLRNTVLSVSRPVQNATRLTATPRATVTTTGRGHVHVQMWDVDANGNAVQINENVSVLSANGTTSFDLKSLDWTLARGHRLGVSVGAIDDTTWRPNSTGETIQVRGSSLQLNTQSPANDVATAGAKSQFLDRYKSDNRLANAFPTTGGDFTVPAP